MFNNSLDVLELNLKLASVTRGRAALISAGSTADKHRLLAAVRKLADIGVRLYATEGTSRFLREAGVSNDLVHKVGTGLSPNIDTLLRDGRFDLIVNILTGNADYDEQSDSRVIRSRAIYAGIPLFTDVDVAEQMIEQIVDDARRGTFRYHGGLAEDAGWDLRSHFEKKVRIRGGYVNHHAHLDKAYLISPDNLKLGQVDMQKKWELYKHLKQNYTHEDLVERISRGVATLVKQGARYCRTMVDADSTVKLLPMHAALEVKKQFRGQIELEIGVQALEGVVDRNARHWYEQACELADFCGGLPSRDRPTPEKHLDIILGIAKSLGKRIDVHVDQENNPYESETEMLALKTVEHGMEGRVFAIHAVSLAAKDASEQDRVCRRLRDAGITVVCCPSAALSMRQLGMSAPLHNSIAPVPRLLEHGVEVCLGVDNVSDLFMPLVDGDMWFEARLLMEACRFYDLDAVADIATNRRPLGREEVPKSGPVNASLAT